MSKIVITQEADRTEISITAEKPVKEIRIVLETQPTQPVSVLPGPGGASVGAVSDGWGRNFSLSPIPSTAHHSFAMSLSRFYPLLDLNIPPDEQSNFGSVAHAAEIDITKRKAPHGVTPPERYMCLWPDREYYEGLVSMVSDPASQLTASERARLTGLLDRSRGIPAESIFELYQPSLEGEGFKKIWVARLTEKDGIEGEVAGARVIGSPDDHDRGVFIVAAVFTEAQYNAYLAELTAIRDKVAKP